jgi:hypothetical protein
MWPVKLIEVTSDGMNRLTGAIPMVYLSDGCLTKQKVVKIGESIYIELPIVGEIKEVDGGYQIEEGNDMITMILAYGGKVTDIEGDCRFIEVQELDEETEKWYGGGLIIVSSNAVDGLIVIKYTVNGIYNGMVHYYYNNQTKEFKIVYHKAYDFMGLPVVNYSINGG